LAVSMARSCRSGDVQGMEEAVTKLIDRYPWLVTDGVPEADDPKPKASARRVGGTKKPDAGVNPQLERASLEKRFKVLKRR
jgi:hypothetical protein